MTEMGRAQISRLRFFTPNKYS